jgi:transposase
LAQRARIVLLAADGEPNTSIAELAGVSRPTVISWRQRYRARGLAGLLPGIGLGTLEPPGRTQQRGRTPIRLDLSARQ